MAVIQKFIYTWPEGTVEISFQDWIDALPLSEQQEYWEGRRNGDRLRQIAIDEGRMIIRDNAYEWRGTEEFAVNKENDPTWERYWLRWQVETGVVFTMKIIKE